jgi:hypothetical protein
MLTGLINDNKMDTHILWMHGVNCQVTCPVYVGYKQPKRHEVTGEWRRLHNKELYVKFQAFAMVHCIKIIFFWAITWHLVKIKNHQKQTLVCNLKQMPGNCPKEDNFNTRNFMLCTPHHI